MTRLVILSDTHGQHDRIEVPDGDILIHAGDLCAYGRLSELIAFNSWLGSLPHKHKIIIAGNHDWPFQEEAKAAKDCITNAMYIQDAAVRVKKLKIYGSPWQPTFFDWAFNKNRGKELAAIWEKIPTDTDIVVTHGPPYRILDMTLRGMQVGCEDLRNRIFAIKPKLHIFGHIHECYGVAKEKGVTFVNACICDENYEARNKAVVFDL